LGSLTRFLLIAGVAEGTIQWVIYEHLKKRQMEAKAERLIAAGQRGDSAAHAKSVQGMYPVTQRRDHTTDVN
jgi:hypothetical protein